MVIRKTFKAEMAHRLTSAYTKRCMGVHGHSYKFEIFIKGEGLDSCEMVMDFKLLKERSFLFLDSFDHTLLISKDDDFLVKNAKNLNTRYIIVPYNPTAEMMAVHIYKHLNSLGLQIVKVIVHETETGCAIYEGEDGFDLDLDKVEFSEELKEEFKNG